MYLKLSTLELKDEYLNVIFRIILDKGKNFYFLKCNDSILLNDIKKSDLIKEQYLDTIPFGALVISYFIQQNGFNIMREYIQQNHLKSEKSISILKSFTKWIKILKQDTIRKFLEVVISKENYNELKDLFKNNKELVAVIEGLSNNKENLNEQNNNNSKLGDIDEDNKSGYDILDVSKYNDVDQGSIETYLTNCSEISLIDFEIIAQISNKLDIPSSLINNIINDIKQQNDMKLASHARMILFLSELRSKYSIQVPIDIIIENFLSLIRHKLINPSYNAHEIIPKVKLSYINFIKCLSQEEQSISSISKLSSIFNMTKETSHELSIFLLNHYFDLLHFLINDGRVDIKVVSHIIQEFIDDFAIEKENDVGLKDVILKVDTIITELYHTSHDGSYDPIFLYDYLYIKLFVSQYEDISNNINNMITLSNNLLQYFIKYGYTLSIHMRKLFIDLFVKLSNYHDDFLNSFLASLASENMTLHINRSLDSPVEPERKKDSFVGLKNLGSTCYMNCLFQYLFHTQEIRNVILSFNPEQEKNEDSMSICEDNEMNIIFQLQRLLTNLLLSRKVHIDPVSLCRLFTAEFNQQQDIDEFFSTLRDRLKEFHPLFYDVFGGSLEQRIVCQKNLQHMNKSIEDFFSLSLDIQDINSLESSFKRFFNGETISGYKCDHCIKEYKDEAIGTVDVDKYYRIKKFPNHLFIHLKRIGFDLNVCEYVKFSHRLSFPKNLDLMEYRSDDSESPDRMKYELNGIIVHRGNESFGHYYLLIRDPINLDKWIKIDDTVVEPFDEKDFEKECYGGQNSIIQESEEELLMNAFYNHEISSPKSTSAYILIYKNIQPQYDYQMIHNVMDNNFNLESVLNQEIVHEIEYENERIEQLKFKYSNQYLSMIEYIIELKYTNIVSNTEIDSSTHSLINTLDLFNVDTEDNSSVKLLLEAINHDSIFITHQKHRIIKQYLNIEYNQTNLSTSILDIMSFAVYMLYEMVLKVNDEELIISLSHFILELVSQYVFCAQYIIWVFSDQYQSWLMNALNKTESENAKNLLIHIVYISMKKIIFSGTTLSNNSIKPNRVKNKSVIYPPKNLMKMNVIKSFITNSISLIKWEGYKLYGLFNLFTLLLYEFNSIFSEYLGEIKGRLNQYKSKLDEKMNEERYKKDLKSFHLLNECIQKCNN